MIFYFRKFENNKFIQHETPDRDTAVYQHLGEHIPEPRDLHEQVERYNIDTQIAHRNKQVERHLRGYALFPRILERPEFLQGETEAKCEEKREDGREEIPYMEVLRKRIEQGELKNRDSYTREQVLE